METKELNTLMTTINDGFNNLVKNTLAPYVRNMEENREQFKTISNVLKQLPEYQNMLATNAELRLEITNLKQQLNNNSQVSLKVTETKNKVIDQTEHVALIYDDARINLNNNCSHIIDDEDDVSYEENTETLSSQSDDTIDDTKIRKIEIGDIEDNRCAHVLDDDGTDWRLTSEQQNDNDDEYDVLDNKEAHTEFDTLLKKLNKSGEDKTEDEEYEESEDEGQQAAGERESWSDAVSGDSRSFCADDYDKNSIEAEDDEEEEAAEEEEEDEEEDDEEEDDEEEEDEEIFTIELEGADDKEYYTNDDENGDIYKILTDGNPGEKVGEFINGEALFD